MLRDAGARFEHHGDFDWEGLAIGQWPRERYGARPWRFDAAAYRAAVAVSRTPLPPLKRVRQSSAHDDGLVAELTRLGVVVSEEAVLDQLVSDLAVRSPDRLTHWIRVVHR